MMVIIKICFISVLQSLISTHERHHFRLKFLNDYKIVSVNRITTTIQYKATE